MPDLIEALGNYIKERGFSRAVTSVKNCDRTEFEIFRLLSFQKTEWIISVVAGSSDSKEKCVFVFFGRQEKLMKVCAVHKITF